MEYTTLIPKILSYFLIINFIGCSQYIDYLENNSEKEIQLRKSNIGPISCNKSNTENTVHQSTFTFNEFPKEIIDSKKINIFDKGVLLTLFQFHSRPDSTDWSSRIQIHAKQGNFVYGEDSGNYSNYPLLKGIKKLERKNLLSKKLNQLIKMGNNIFPKKITVQKELNSYLKGLKDIAPPAKKLYKLGKPLQIGESYLRENTTLPKNQKETTIYTQQKYNIDKSIEGFTCNFDTGLYKNGIFLISPKINNENIFGIFNKNGDYFLAITKKISQENKSYPRQLLPGNASKSVNPFCRYSGKDRSFTLIAMNSRDPGQLLYHLYNYGIYEAKNSRELVNYLNFPRHQFLTKPSRLLFESKKGTEQQLRYFLSLDFPVYHTEKLGNIHAIWEKEGSLFISDQRTKLKQSCLLK